MPAPGMGPPTTGTARVVDTGSPGAATDPATPTPPAGMQGTPGWFLALVRDQRVAFLMVGAANTAIGFFWFVTFQSLVGRWVHYLGVLLLAHVASVLCAFVLYRKVVFRVHGHVWSDLWRFESVYLGALGVNLVLLPLLVELAGLRPIVAQLVIVSVTSVMSWFGHRYFSFRRRDTGGGGR